MSKYQTILQKLINENSQGTSNPTATGSNGNVVTPYVGKPYVFLILSRYKNLKRKKDGTKN